jgi:Ca2+-binding EF-hand superfamily protein
MISELRRKKIVHYFRLWDLKHTGCMEYEDYLLLTRRIAQLQRIDPGSELYNQMVAYTNANWIEMSRVADQDGDGRISLQEWMDYSFITISLIEQGDYDRMNETNLFIRTFFDLIDEDHDGAISAKDWRRFTIVWGIDEDAAEHFARLDTDNDGRMSYDDLVELWMQFLLSDDYESPGNFLFGNFL